jgi:NADP-dependent 3-hydroxy acid dehydrogenase YdfG
VSKSHKAGHTVYASMRDPKSKNKTHADELYKQGIKVVELDVTSDASVDTAVSEVVKSAGKIDVLQPTRMEAVATKTAGLALFYRLLRDQCELA